MKKYQVIVGNIGTATDTNSFKKALIDYKACKSISMADYGRASGEDVILMADNEILYSYLGHRILED